MAAKSPLFRADDAWAMGETKMATTLYQVAAQEQPDRALPLYLEGLARLQVGQAERGQALIEQATYMPLAQSAARAKLAYGLSLRHHDEQALRQWRLLWRHAPPDSPYRINIAARMAEDKARHDKDYPAAVKTLEVSQLHLLRNDISVSDTSYTVAARIAIARYQILDAIKAKDMQSAREHIRRAQSILPLEIEWVIEVHNTLLSGEHAALGQRVFDETFQALRARCEQVPRFAEIHNEAAWLAARCRKELATGEALARRALALEPDNPAYLDTLAEILFQQHKREQAVSLIQRCIKLEPKMRYFKRQLERFQKGDPSSAPPE
jgi:tetratricopeptide (TPR) repeat protein